MKQSDAVFTAVCNITGQESFDSPVELSKEQRQEIHETILEGFKSGTVNLSDDARKKYNTDSSISGYTSGLISNWLRKDKRLNGGVNYVPKNPGSRAGQGDPMIRELRKLKKLHTGTEKEVEIDGYINARLTELKVSKAKEININTDLIPEALRDLV